MVSIPRTLIGPFIVILGLAFIYVGPVLAQRPDQNAPDAGKQERASSDQSLEQAIKELASLDRQVREARQQQADERVAAAQTIAALKAEREQLKRDRDENERRLAIQTTGNRETTPSRRAKPLSESTIESLDTLLKTVDELRQTLDRSLPSKASRAGPANDNSESRANDKERGRKP